MNKKQTYNVAGHTFCLIMKENESLWQGIDVAYSPFAVPNQVSATTQPPRFTLTLIESIEATTSEILLTDPNPNANEMKLDVHRTSSGYLFSMRLPFTDEQHCRLYLSNHFRKAEVVLCGNDFERLSGINSALMLCYLLSTARLSTVLTHASAVVNDGKAYLFLGRSGTGKSTHSRLWQQTIEGTTLLNDDHPILRTDEQGRITAYGSPWSGKTPCYRNESAPVGGIVRIKRALKNNIRRLSPIESYASLLTSCSGMTWEKELADGKDHSLQQIIAAVPCWTLECLPDEAAARVCAQAVRKEGQRCNG